MRIIVGISGASGVLLGYRLLQALKNNPAVETHLVVSEGAVRNFALETSLLMSEVEDMANIVYSNADLAADIASGSFVTDGMVTVPCSMKTVAGIASGYAENLLQRAADVCMKENRKLVIVPREMPFSQIHLRNLTALAAANCCIIPPMLTFYNNSLTLDEQMDHIIGKIFMQFGMEYTNFKKWKGR